MTHSKLLINEPPLQVLPTLAAAIGLNEAIVLQQLHYFTSSPHMGEVMNGVRYFKAKQEKLSDPETGTFKFWSLSTLKRILENLREMNLIIQTDKLNNRREDRTLWYAVNYETLALTEALIEAQRNYAKCHFELMPIAQNELMTVAQNDTLMNQEKTLNYQESLLHGGAGQKFTIPTNDKGPGLSSTKGDIKASELGGQPMVEYKELSDKLPKRLADPDYGRVMRLWESSFSWPSPPIAGKISEIYDSIEPPATESKYQWFEYAIKRAKEIDAHGRPHHNLVFAIIEGGARPGLKQTGGIAQSIAARENSHKESKNDKPNPSSRNSPANQPESARVQQANIRRLVARREAAKSQTNG